MNHFIAIFFVFVFGSSQAQVLIKSNVFSLASSNLETSKQIACIPVGNDFFISLSKVKGTQSGISDFVLEKYDLNLQAAYSIPLQVPQEEDYKELHLIDNVLYLFSEMHDILNKKKGLKVYAFNPDNGTKLFDKIIHEQTVGPWLAGMTKGASKETFEMAVSASLPANFDTPLEYIYNIHFSPDKKTVLIYTYDYSQKNLAAHAIICDTKFNILNQGNIGIDNNFINYGIYVNNKGQIHILNCDKVGRIVLIRFDMNTKDNVFLDIQSSITKRDGLVLQFLSDDEIYVANTITSNRKLMGVMYSKFDFRENVVSKLNVYDISQGLIQTSKALRSTNKTVSSEENWINFQITDFIVNEYEKVILVIEKRDIEVINYSYDAGSVNDVKNWMEKTGKVHAEAIILLSFNKDDEMLWENYYLKAQSNDISAGILSASFSMNVSDEGKIRLVYANSDNSTGVFNEIHYVEWNELNGSKVKDLALQNDEGVSVLRNFVVWWENKLVIAGRKGLLGKKSFVNIYSINGKS